MPPQSGSTTLETLPATRRVHVVGAGPVGLLLTALLQSMEGFSVHLYEKRREYSRTRMVQLGRTSWRTQLRVTVPITSMETTLRPSSILKSSKRA